ncbi:hypothetical protein LINPERHAP2_LOCUS14333 [Linum perenne]
MTRKLQFLWAKQGRVSVWDIGFGHFVAKFETEADFNRALLDGPWLVGDHYVVSEEWRPNFEPGFSQVNSVRVWVRLPGIPLENYDAAILKIIGDRIGKTVRVDGTTLFGNRGNYARICVEVDLHKPLLSKYRLRRRVRRIEYEGLHEICFTCGRYGHEEKACPSIKLADPALSQHVEKSFDNPIFKEFDARPEVEEDFGPWMKAKKHMRHRKSAPKVGPAVEGKEAGGSRFSPIGEEDPSQDNDPQFVAANVTEELISTGNPTSDHAKPANKVGVVADSTPEESASVPFDPEVEVAQQNDTDVIPSYPLEVLNKQNSEVQVSYNNRSSSQSHMVRERRAATEPLLQQVQGSSAPHACNALDFVHSPRGRKVGDKPGSVTLLKNKERNNSGGGGTQGSTQKWKGDPTKSRPPL